MSLEETTIQEKILRWAYDRHLHTAKPEVQLAKLMEEVGELAADILKGRDPRDSLGDTWVVLLVLCTILKVTPEECMQVAYEEIKDRKGKLVNGVFIKEADYVIPNCS